MFHEFNDDLRVHIDRDNEGVARNVLHVEEPYLSSARTAQLAAREYLEIQRPVRHQGGGVEKPQPATRDQTH
jgi:hypothetical protein